MKATEREQKVREAILSLHTMRNALIDATRGVAALGNVKTTTLLNMIFTRNWAEGYTLAWWKNNSVRLQAQWQRDEAYQSAVAKLTAEERKVLGL
jgi:hypothetical protein